MTHQQNASFNPMSELTVSAGKFKRVLDYLEHVGLDTNAIAARVNIAPARINGLDDDVLLPALQYARLYKSAVIDMQTLGHPIPWGAGVGSEAFELMCRCVIGTRTLGAALQVAQRYDSLLYPMIGYRIQLLEEPDTDSVRLAYHVRLPGSDSVMAPAHWDRAESQETLARASGLLVWSAFCGWLTGQAMELKEVHIAAPYLDAAYYDRLVGVFHCPVRFDATDTTLTFPRSELERRIVQTTESLQEFLEGSIYHLIAVDSRQASTSSAIKSLVTIDLPQGLPSFASVAESLHMSESSLRRRLQKENTSYQALKDEIRCEAAIDQLLNHDTKVADIAEYLGFTEPSSFVRSFKNWTGQTPRSYRERMRALGDSD